MADFSVFFCVYICSGVCGHWESLKITSAILKKMNKVGGLLILPDTKTYSKAAIIKTGQYCHKDRQLAL